MMKHLFLQCRPRKKQFNTDLAHRWYVRFLNFFFFALLLVLLSRFYVYRLVILNPSIKIKFRFVIPIHFL